MIPKGFTMIRDLTVSALLERSPVGYVNTHLSIKWLSYVTQYQTVQYSISPVIQVILLTVQQDLTWFARTQMEVAVDLI